MKKFMLNLIMKFFKKEIEEIFIEEDFKTYKIDKKNSQVLEKLSDLYLYPEYKFYSQLLSNRAKSLAIQGMRMKYSDDKELLINHSFIRGQIFGTAFSLRIVKSANLKYQNLAEKEKGRI